MTHAIEISSSIPSALPVREFMDVWSQAGNPLGIPVIRLPPKRGRVLLRLPYRPDTLSWLHIRGNRRWVQYLIPHDEWTVPRAWLDDIVPHVVRRYAHAYMVRDFSHLERCARKCWAAKGFECVCQCGGTKHGQHDDQGWWEISETCALRWTSWMGCALLRAKTAGHVGPVI